MSKEEVKKALEVQIYANLIASEFYQSQQLSYQALAEIAKEKAEEAIDEIFY